MTKYHTYWTALTAWFIGALFALGLTISGMVQPDNVQGFLNIAGLFDPTRFGAWNPSLVWVMVGGIAVSSVAFALTPRRARPWLMSHFDLPKRTDIDRRLLIGAALFGIGWGLVGYCPGPALATLGVGGAYTLVFVISMLSGMWLAKRYLGAK